MNETKTTTIAIRSWLGIPYVTAERFNRPILLRLGAALPYDR
ncbi:hypothetical protein [Variovorax guangxiensis]|nr:hypothetical protein [Variovorax guangxiensis]MDR6858601.1 carboxylesterase type B [Variovorax guangxiensis]